MLQQRLIRTQKQLKFASVDLDYLYIFFAVIHGMIIVSVSY